jgi:hypothetical protein
MTEWNEILTAIGVALSGDKHRGHQLLMDCWSGTSETDHATRCVLAHYIADLQDDLEAEVAWDERALAAYRHVDPLAFSPIGVASAEGFAPSLHLNLGDGYRRLGRIDDARSQLDAGLAGIGALPEADGYTAMVRNGLDRLGERLSDQFNDR